MRAAAFADTSYYLALVSPRDALHARAEEVSRSLTVPVVTGTWIVQELADGLCAPPARGAFIRLFDTLQADPDTTIFEADATLWRRGIDLYRARPDKSWSLTDCLSFVVMADLGISDALTADHHFEQAGFFALLRPN